jgi:hypothetical protein
VAYFLRPSGQQAGSSPLYALYRRRRLLVDTRDRVPDSQLFVQETPGITGSGGGAPKPPASSQLTDVSYYGIAPSGFASSLPRLYINTPANITVPYRRLGMNVVNQDPQASAPAGVPTPGYRSINEENYNKNIANPNANPGGDDILLENVLSFEIKTTWDVPTDPRINRVQGPASFVAPGPTVAANPEYPFDNLPVTPSSFGNDALAATGARVFDTWRGEDYIDTNAGPQYPLNTVRYSLWNNRYETGQATAPPLMGATPTDLRPLTIPLRIRVKAIQIRLRVWDTKTQQARQVTIVQDL